MDTDTDHDGWSSAATQTVATVLFNDGELMKKMKNKFISTYLSANQKKNMRHFLRENEIQPPVWAKGDVDHHQLVEYFLEKRYPNGQITHEDLTNWLAVKLLKDHRLFKIDNSESFEDQAKEAILDMPYVIPLHRVHYDRLQQRISYLASPSYRRGFNVRAALPYVLQGMDTEPNIVTVKITEPGATPMNNPRYEERAYYGEQPLANMTDSDIVATIADLETRIKSLDKIEVESKSIEKEKENMKNTVLQLAKFLDNRNG